ncbi:MAG: SDR family oxidoreductase [Anaerolineae bacterium]|jgi:NAD(P)-dependent dehydrogenase (short-subunit alcohol dehydrogenase family)|nr:SDR family oxidoreductase [Anaerolineae bacterium]
MTDILITGANRGIGLALVAEYLGQPGTRVFAACRRPEAAAALLHLAQTHPQRVFPLALEVTAAAALPGFIQSLRAHTARLDILINNAGVYPPEAQQALPAVTEALLLETLHINAVAPLLIVQACLPLLAAGSRVVNISSDMGSIGGRTYRGAHPYGMSKAALNMASRGLALELRSQQIIVVAMDPGWVRTDMSPTAHMPAAESAAGIARVTAGLTLADTGTYRRWNGETVPW